MNRLKTIALIMCILLFTVVAASFPFMIVNPHHDCIGHDCSVCAKIQECKSLLPHIPLIAGVIFFALFFTRHIYYIYPGIELKIGPFTLVSLKVKLTH